MQQFNRFEFKYVLSPLIAQSIQEEIKKYGMKPDPKSLSFPKNTYPVTSLYYDSPFMQDYADKAAGLLVRKKIRIRIYTPTLTPSTQEIWLERKDKHEMLVSKKRIKLSHHDYELLLYGSRSHLLQKLLKDYNEKAKAIFVPLLAQSMRPKVIVRYQRTPFISATRNDLRITFDRTIKTCENSDLRYTRLMTNVYPNSVVMEVKFLTILPYWFGIILNKYNLSRTAFSKYANSVEMVHKYYPISR